MHLKFEKHGHVAHITINRQETMNSLDASGVRELRDVLMAFRDEKGLRVGIITGAGDVAFCAGADVTAFSSGAQASPFYDLDLWKPLIAAINGYCFAGGLALALLCDIRIASVNAAFASEGPRGGVLPAGGVTQRLTRLIGVGPALALMLTSQSVTAEEALKMRIVNEVVYPRALMSRANQIAEQMASMAPLALQATKEAALRGLGMGLAEGLNLERQLNSLLLQTKDAQEALQATHDKRKPDFQGQ